MTLIEKVAGVLVIAATCAITGCSGQKETQEYLYIYQEEPDGKKTIVFRHKGTNTEGRVEGESFRELIDLIPKRDEMGVPGIRRYRYEYRFDITDADGNPAGTVAFDSYEEFVTLMPTIFDAAELPVPSQAELDDLAAEVFVVWISPEEDWHLFN